ncbi:MAG: type II toxin-antitoxin system VapC family toxin [Candidatus Heimdallarchaeota archaeon]|nr:MAG: type II toxin-antitoxin system VapC family toxin [Candidatus Heimdallarchaeota archaeon]
MIFIDTGAFFASKVKNDVNNPSAVKIEKEIQQGKYGKMITTNYILDELYTLLRGRVSHEETIQIGETIRRSRNIRIIWILEALEEKSWDFFKEHQDKTYSFTDCTCFVVMRSLGINIAFSYDSHFEQAGFRIIG